MRHVDSSSPVKIGRALPKILPLILASLSSTQSAGEEDEADHDLKEVALQALEALVLKCPTEVSGSIKQITSVAVEWVKWDPVSSPSSTLPELSLKQLPPP